MLIAEQYEALMAALPGEDLRLIARLRLEDYSNAEIAQKLSRSERTIERKVNLIRGYWEQTNTA